MTPPVSQPFDGPRPHQNLFRVITRSHANIAEQRGEAELTTHVVVLYDDDDHWDAFVSWRPFLLYSGARPPEVRQFAPVVADVRSAVLDVSCGYVGDVKVRWSELMYEVGSAWWSAGIDDDERSSGNMCIEVRFAVGDEWPRRGGLGPSKATRSSARVERQHNGDDS